MQRTLFFITLLCAAGASAQTLSVQQEWQHIDGMHLPRGFGETVGDFDGDGIGDVAVLTEQSGSHGIGASIGIVGFDPVEGWRWKSVVHESVRLAQPLLTMPHADGDQILVLRGQSFIGQPVDLVRYGGMPLRELSALPLDPVDDVTLLAAGDVDGDGDMDVIERVRLDLSMQYVVRARDIGSGLTLWSRDVQAISSTDITAELAQLDADPALEVIVGGAPGLVLDGALGLTEWSYAAGFGAITRAGNFDADTSTTEFVSMNGQTATLFQSAPYASTVAMELACCGLDLRVADIDNDGVDEWIGAGGGLFIVEPISGAATLVNSPGIVKRSVRVGNMDADPALEIVINGYQAPRPHLRVIDSDTADTVFNAWAIAAPGFPMVVADLEGNGGQQIAYLSSLDDVGVLYIRDAATGALLRSESLPEFGNGSLPLPMIIAAGQLDDDPALELAVGPKGMDGWGSRVVVLDSVDFTRMYTIEYTQLPMGARTLEFADIDADGEVELVTLGTDVRVRVFNGATGAPLWSTSEPAFYNGAGMVLRNVDADPALEILVTNGRDIFAFDGATQALEWMVGASHTDNQLAVFDRDAVCRMALYGNHGYREFPCDGDVAAPLVWPATPLTRILPVSLDGNGLLAISQERLVRFDAATGGTSPISGNLGFNLGVLEKSIVVQTPDRIFVGNDGVIARLGLIDTAVFDDGFE